MVKAGWIEIALGEIAELRGRIGWKGLTAKEYTKSGPRFLSVHSLNYGDYVDFRDAFHISQKRYDESPEIMLQQDDILICKDGAGIGKLGVVPEVLEPTTINSSLLLIRPGPKVLPKYLYFCLLSPYFQEIVKSRLEGATTPHLYQRDITTFPVFLPPLEEQQRIVAVLDKSFEGLARARAHAEANLQNARELFERQLGEYFSERPKNWISRKLKQITSKIGSGATPKGGAGAYKTEGISLIRSLNVHDRWFKEDKLAFIDDEQADKLSNVIIEERDVLLNITGASIARCCVAHSDFLPARVNQHVSIIRPDHTVLSPEFLVLMLTSQPYKDGLLKTGEDNGSTRQALTKALIENLEVAFPPDVSEQEAVVLDLRAAELKSKELAEAYQTKIQDLDDLRQSLLQKAFAGELT